MSQRASIKIDAIELEASSARVRPSDDRRPRMPEPLPVRLVSIADVMALAPEGVEAAMDRLYVAILGFERAPELEYPGCQIYRAENFMLRIERREAPVERKGYTPVRIEVRSLAAEEAKLIEAEIPFDRQKGLTPGEESLFLHDPGGNVVELVEARGV